MENTGKPDDKLSNFSAFQAKEHKCPKCNSIIYSRRNALCGACGEKLPPELLFSPAEREVVEQELRDAKSHRRHAEPSAIDNVDFGGGGIL